ncbi:Fic family protein [Corynebacterium glutamicum]|uniref:Fic family protein n=1 Tax=Corynebacterium glutamicum TaxID=1718 RepID=UPI0014669B69|nr:Fic family protein [Corynebacterium glutamicum]GFK17960.1 hypothetical protein KbCgl_05320 [Corynebacterium glutamicum]
MMERENDVAGLLELTDVIFTAAKVFDNLGCSRPATRAFLKTGSTTEIYSRTDLALLQDLRDAALFVIRNATLEVDADHLRGINNTLVRSGARNPGQLRTDSQNIGVSTVYGRHVPPALTLEQLDDLCRIQHEKRRVMEMSVEDRAIELFISISRAQPFEDGNKRTSLFAANSMLISAGSRFLLTAPLGDAKTDVTRSFTDYLARFYLFREDFNVKKHLRQHGLQLR